MKVNENGRNFLIVGRSFTSRCDQVSKFRRIEHFLRT